LANNDTIRVVMLQQQFTRMSILITRQRRRYNRRVRHRPSDVHHAWLPSRISPRKPTTGDRMACRSKWQYSQM